MTTRYLPEPTDQALVHQFIRIVGRRPTLVELEQYECARSKMVTRIPARIRRRAACVIARW